MAYVYRAVFYGKPGKAGDLVSHHKEMIKAMSRYGGTGVKTRILTDFMSGRSDRVIVEWETETPEQLSNTMSQILASPEAEREFREWEARLQELIYYADHETLMIQHSE